MAEYGIHLNNSSNQLQMYETDSLLCRDRIEFIPLGNSGAGNDVSLWTTLANVGGEWTPLPNIMTGIIFQGDLAIYPQKALFNFYYNVYICSSYMLLDHLKLASEISPPPSNYGIIGKDDNNKTNLDTNLVVCKIADVIDLTSNFKLSTHSNNQVIFSKTYDFPVSFIFLSNHYQKEASNPGTVAWTTKFSYTDKVFKVMTDIIGTMSGPQFDNDNTRTIVLVIAL